jgi:hypothetical protein
MCRAADRKEDPGPMRRTWAVCAALILLVGCGAGCSRNPAPDQGEIKQAFIR